MSRNLSACELLQFYNHLPSNNKLHFTRARAEWTSRLVAAATQSPGPSRRGVPPARVALGDPPARSTRDACKDALVVLGPVAVSLQGDSTPQHPLVCDSGPQELQQAAPHVYGHAPDASHQPAQRTRGLQSVHLEGHSRQTVALAGPSGCPSSISPAPQRDKGYSRTSPRGYGAGPYAPLAVLQRLEQDSASLFTSKEACLRALGALAAAPPPPADLPSRGLADHLGFAALLAALRQHFQAAGAAAAAAVGGAASASASASAGAVPGGNAAASLALLEELLRTTRQLLRLRLRAGAGSGAGVGGGVTPGEEQTQARSGRRGRNASQLGRAPGVVDGSAGPVVEAGGGTDAADAVGALLDVVAAAAAECLDAMHRVERTGLGVNVNIGDSGEGNTRADSRVDSAAPHAPVRTAAASAAALLHNLVKLGRFGGSAVRRLTEAAAAAAVRNSLAAALDGRALQDLVWALGKVDPSFHTLPEVRQLLDELTARLGEPGLLAAMAASPVGLSMVVYGMGKVGVRYGDARVRLAVCAAVAAAAARPDCGPQALSNMAWGLSRTLPPPRPSPPSPFSAPPSASPPPPLLQLQGAVPAGNATAGARPGTSSSGGGCGTSFQATPYPNGASAVAPAPSVTGDSGAVQQAAAALADAATRQLESFKPRELCNLLGAMASLGATADPRVAQLMAAALPFLRRRLPDMGPQDLAEVLYTYGTASASAAVVSDSDGEDLAAAAAAAAWPQAITERHGQGAGAPAGVRAGVYGGGGGGGGGGLVDAELAAALERRCLEVLPACPSYQVGTMLWGFAHLPAHTPTRLVAAVCAALDRAGVGAEPLNEVPGAGRQDQAQGQHQRQPPPHQQPQQQRQSSPWGQGAPEPRRASRYAESVQVQVHGRGHGHLDGSGRQHYSQDPEVVRGAAGAGLKLELESPKAMPASNLARMLWALARLRADVSPGALSEVCRVLRLRLAELGAQELLVCAWALATLGCPLTPDLEPLAGRMASVLPSLAPPQLAMALWSVARLMGAAGGGLPGMAALRLFQASRGPLAAALPRLGPQAISMVAWAYTEAGVNPGEAVLGTLWERAAVLMAEAAQGPGRGPGSGPAPGQAGAYGLLPGPARVLGPGRGGGGAAASGGGGMSDQALAMLGRAMAEFRCRHQRAVPAFAAAVAARLAAPLPRPPLPPTAATGLEPAPAGRHAGGDAGGGGRRSGVGVGGGDVSRADAIFLSSVVCSLGRLGIRSGRLLGLACRRAAVLAPALSAREAVPLLWGLGAMCSPGALEPAPQAPAGPRTADDGAAASGARGALVCPPGIVASLSRVAEAAICRDALAAAAAAGSGGAAGASGASAKAPRGSAQPDLDGRLLSMFLLACVAHCHRPAPLVLQAACALLSHRLSSLSSHTLCELAWAVATLLPPPGGDVGLHVMLPLRRRQAPEAPVDLLAAGAPAAAAAAAEGGTNDHRGRQAVDVKVKVEAEAEAEALRGAVALLSRRERASRREWFRRHCLKRESAEAGKARPPRSERLLEGRSRRLALPWRRVRKPRMPSAPGSAGPAPDASDSTAVDHHLSSSPSSEAASFKPSAKHAGVAAAPAHPLLRFPWRSVPQVALFGRSSGPAATPVASRATPPSAPRPASPSATQAMPPAGAARAVPPAAGRAQPPAVPTPQGTSAAQPAGTPRGKPAAQPGPRLAAPPVVTHTPLPAETWSALPPAAARQGAPAASPAEPASAPPAPPAVRQKRTGTPPTPPAVLAGRIYPPPAAQPREYAGSRALLARAFGLLALRLCVLRSEVLTLGSLVRVTWAMCVTRMYAPRLFRYCAPRAICCSTRALEPLPGLLRALIEVRAMVARQRPSAWRSLRLRGRWRRRLNTARGGGGDGGGGSDAAAGGGGGGGTAVWRVAPDEVLAEQPPEMVRQLLRCRGALEAAAEAAELPFEWRNTFEGERLAVMRLGPGVAFTLVLLPPWQLPAAAGSAPAAAEADAAAAAASAAAAGVLASGAVTVRLLRLRGWLVAGVHVERWLALGPREQQEQLAALYGMMREAARRRALAAAAAGAAAGAGGPPGHGAAGASAGRKGAKGATRAGGAKARQGKKSEGRRRNHGPSA